MNPVAGTGNNVKRGENLKKILNKRNVFAEIIVSDAPGQITDIVKEIATTEQTRFYSVGGDGTLNEVISGLVGTNSEVVVIPSGTGNDFMKSVSKYKSLRKIAIDSIVKTSTPTDVMLFNNSKYCVNILNLGFDSKVAENVEKFRKIPFITGSMKYNLSIFYTLLENRNYRLKIKIGNTVKKGSFTLCAIANGKYYGGGVCPCPTADVTDGILNVCIVTSSSIFKKLLLLPKYKKGQHETIKELQHIDAKEIIVVSPKTLPISIDGEIIFTNKVRVKVLPKAINVVHCN